MLLIDGRELTYTSRHGRHLLCSVRVTVEPTIPPTMETILPCRVTIHNFCLLGLVKGYAEDLPVATNLNWPQHNVQMVAICKDPMEQALTLRVGSTIGTFTAVEADQMAGWKQVTGCPAATRTGARAPAVTVPLRKKKLSWARGDLETGCSAALVRIQH